MTAAATSSTSGEQISQRRMLQTICLALTATFVVYADLAIVNIASPVIERELKASVTDLELMVAGYQIACAAMLVTGGRLADILGCRKMFTLAFGSFVLTSAACGLADTAGQLIVFRVLQGVAAALLAPQVVAIIQVALPAQRRSGAFAALGAVISIASTGGPLLGGFLIWANVFGLSWRPVFLVNVPIGILAIVLGVRIIPTFSDQEAKRLDFTGTLLVAAVLVAVMVPLTLGQLYHWPVWAWLSLASTVILGPLFLWSQRWSERRGADPLLPSVLWQDRTFRLGFLLYFLLFSGVVSFFLYNAILVQLAYRVTPLWLAAATIPFGIATALFSTFSGRFMQRWGDWRVLAFGAGLCGAGFGSLLLPVTQVRSGLVVAWDLPSELVMGAGLGLVIAPLLGVVLAGIRSTEAGAASGLLSVAQVIGGAIGVGLMGLLFQSQLPGRGVSATAGQLRSGMTYSLLFNPITFGLSTVIIVAFFKSTRQVARQPVDAGAPANDEFGSALG